MKLQEFLKIMLDELRMLMLGAQVLFGFQFHSVLQERFQDLSLASRAANSVAMTLMVLTFGLLISVPARHRVVEKGETSTTLIAYANRAAKAALLLFSLALALDAFAVTSLYFGETAAMASAALALAVALVLLFGLAEILKSGSRRASMAHIDGTVPLHAKIDQMLTEARVVLPGAQALLGFQFIAVLTNAFADLSPLAQKMHFVALAAVGLSIMLLIAPAAVHRIAFVGQDDVRFHRIGSRIVGFALVPLAVGIAADFFVAQKKLPLDDGAAAAAAGAVFLLLIGLWYALPLALRAQKGR